MLSDKTADDPIGRAAARHGALCALTERPGQGPAVLYLTNNLPVPPHSGGQLREFEILRRLGGAYRIGFVAFIHGTLPSVEHIQWALTFLEFVVLVPVDATVPDAAHLTSRVRSCYAAQGRKLVGEILSTFDASLIHLEGYFLLQHVPPTRIPLQLTAENIEHSIFGLAEFGPSASARVAEEEVSAWKRAGSCIAVTEEDATIMRRLAPGIEVHCITNGFDHVQPLTAAREQGCNATALYAANYGWYPSHRAALNLLQDVWPSVSAKDPEFRLLLAGKAIDSGLSALASRVDSVALIGEYEAFSDVAAKASVFAFPMSVGSGIKVKLIDAFVSGLAVVTTELALSGFPNEVGRHAIASDDLTTLSNGLLLLLSDPIEARNRGRLASEAISRTLPTWDRVAQRVDTAWRCATSTE